MSTAVDYESLMAQAYVQATRSDDPSTQNGAVLIQEYEDEHYVILGHGFNHFPHGVNTDHWYGPKEAKYARVVHAETGALLSAARHGNKTVGSTLVCPWAACSNCSKHIADAGVTRLVRHTFSNNGVTTGNHWYADCLIGDEIMIESGVEILEIEPVTTQIQLRRDGKLWTPNG